MNILYISKLAGGSWAGPTYSVPKQVFTQSLFDEVFWYNLRAVDKTEWKQTKYYHDIAEFPKGTIKDLPEPFSKPDLVVVEQFYSQAKTKVLFELLCGDLPYIIIPRGELTAAAQKRKSLKKRLANAMMFRKFAKKAVAIQYLTRQEKEDSGNRWNNNALVLPNGTDIPAEGGHIFSENGIKCISIGRIEPYQKGLDLLIEACGGMKEELKAADCSILLCGPDRVGKLQELQSIVREKGLEEIIQFHDGVYGEEKARLLREHDVFLMPSRFEGHPMALIEALAYGLPCLVTTGSNMRDEVAEYDVGWTADNTVESIRTALLHMLAERSSLRQKSERAKQLARNYAWEEIAARSHHYYMDLIGG